MSLKIVTGGTTGAADGTLVSSGHHFVFTAVDTVLNLHLRCDDDTYSADSTISLPSDGGIQISFDGGSTWKAFADSPTPVVTGIGGAGLDVGDLNFPIKLRQHASTATASGQITSDGTFTAATALGDVSGFTVTPGNAQNALSWSAVTNRTAYRIDRATDSGFTAGVALDISPGQTTTSFTDTSLTNGTTYYYRIKAVGTYRYKDSASYATGNGAPVATLYAGDTFTGTDGTFLSAHTPTGPGAAGSWVRQSAAGSELAIASNRLRASATAASPVTGSYRLSGADVSDFELLIDLVPQAEMTGSFFYLQLRSATDSSSLFYVTWNGATGLLSAVRYPSAVAIGSWAKGSAVTANTSLRIRCIGANIDVYVDEVLRISGTGGSVTAPGGTWLALSSNTGNSAASGFHVDNFVLRGT